MKKSLRGFQIAIDMKEPWLITSKVVPSVPSTSECSKKCKHFPLYKSLQEIVFGPVSFFRVKTVGVSMNIIWIFFPFHLLRLFLIDRNVVSTESPFWRKQWLATDYGMWIWMHIIECGKLWNIYNSQSKGLREVIKCHLSLLSLRLLKVQCKTLKLTFEPGNVLNRN